MKELPKCSLVTPTYNWPEALELLLLSITKQTVLPNEVIVADDGSKEETRLLIERFQKSFPVPLIHVWHEDNGNQKPKIILFILKCSNKFRNITFPKINNFRFINSVATKRNLIII